MMDFSAPSTVPRSAIRRFSLFPLLENSLGFVTILVIEDPEFGKDFHKRHLSAKHGRPLIPDGTGNVLLVKPFFPDLHVNQTVGGIELFHRPFRVMGEWSRLTGSRMPQQAGNLIIAA